MADDPPPNQTPPKQNGRSEAATLKATERWFRHRGVPHFIEDYSGRSDILTRALPFLTLVLLFEIFFIMDPDWRWWVNSLLVVGGLAALVAIWAGVNRLRKRPLFSLPSRVGWVELTVFVLVPGLILASLAESWADSWEILVVLALLNLAVLAVVYIVVSYALLSIFGWALRRLISDIRGVVVLFARALPLLLLIVTFLFINGEVWQLAGRLSGGYLGAVIGLFVVVTGVFLIFRMPAEIGELEHFASAEQVARLVQGTPAENHADSDGSIRFEAPLRVRQWLNAGLVVLFTLALQVVFVSALVGVFFMIFGVLSVDSDLVATWTGVPSRVLLDLEVGGRVITLELVQVAAFLAVFSGFHFTVSVVSDKDYREEFFEDVVREVRQAFAVRAVYLAIHAHHESNPAAEPHTTSAEPEEPQPDHPS